VTVGIYVCVGARVHVWVCMCARVACACVCMCVCTRVHVSSSVYSYKVILTILQFVMLKTINK